MSLPGRERATSLVVSTIGMFILLLFNERESITVAEIADVLQIDEQTVFKNLACLFQPKYKILSLEKQTATAEDSTGDVKMIDTSSAA